MSEANSDRQELNAFNKSIGLNTADPSVSKKVSGDLTIGFSPDGDNIKIVYWENHDTSNATNRYTGRATIAKSTYMKFTTRSIDKIVAIILSGKKKAEKARDNIISSIKKVT